VFADDFLDGKGLLLGLDFLKSVLVVENFKEFLACLLPDHLVADVQSVALGKKGTFAESDF